MRVRTTEQDTELLAFYAQSAGCDRSLVASYRATRLRVVEITFQFDSIRLVHTVVSHWTDIRRPVFLSIFISNHSIWALACSELDLPPRMKCWPWQPQTRTSGKDRQANKQAIDSEIWSGVREKAYRDWIEHGLRYLQIVEHHTYTWLITKLLLSILTPSKMRNKASLVRYASELLDSILEKDRHEIPDHLEKKQKMRREMNISWMLPIFAVVTYELPIDYCSTFSVPWWVA